MEDASLLVALAGMFADPAGPPDGMPSLADDATAACDVPGHEPAYGAVTCMAALFPGLIAPGHAPAP